MQTGHTPRANDLLDCYSTWMTAESNFSYVGLRRIELDGNISNNTDPLLNPGNYANNVFGDFHQAIINTPHWAGFWVSPVGATVVRLNSQVLVEDVHIHDFASNCMLGAGPEVWTGRNIKLGNSAGNHLGYDVCGTIYGLTMYGFWWNGGFKSPGLHIKDLRVQERATNPYFPLGAYIISSDGPFYDGTDLALDYRYHRRGLRIDGFSFELGEYMDSVMFAAHGRGLSVTNGTIILEDDTDKTSTMGITGEFAEGDSQHIHLSNILVITRGARMRLTWNKLGTTNFVADNITFSTDSSYTQAAATGNDHLFRFDCMDRGVDPFYDAPRTYTFRNIDDWPRNKLFAVEDEGVGAQRGQHINVYIQDSTFRLDTNTIIDFRGGVGTSAGMSGFVGRINFFWERCTFIIDPALSGPENRWAFINMSKFRDCTHF